MDITITGKANPLIQPPATKNDKAETNPTQNSGVVEDREDVTALTQEIKSALDSTSVVNEDKVASIKAAVENGQFQINTDSIAEKILQIDGQFDNS